MVPHAVALCPLRWQWRQALGLLLGTVSILTPRLGDAAQQPATGAAVVVNLTVDAANKTHRIRPLDMGCHSDTGYSHQPMGLHAQRIYGPSFESAPVNARTDGTGWLDVSSGSGEAEQDTSTAFHGSASEKLVLTGTGRAAVANRGLGNEGLYFEGGKEYEGYFFAQVAKPTELVLSIEAWDVSGTSTVVANTTILVGNGDSSESGGAIGGGWQMVNFSLTPVATTECNGLVPDSAEARAVNITCPVNETYDPMADMSDRTAHICVRCGGQFVMALEEPGQVHLDFVYLAPGQWGRLKGLPVLAEGARWLEAMGTKIFRMGGSFCDDSAYFWKRWRGKPWTRPTASTSWGHDFEGGWGPFESIDMANAMNVVAVMTTFAVGDVHIPATGSTPATTRKLTAEDMADLVEYSFGDASTKWGKIRIEEDQHPAIYNWSYIELGNEQYNPDFVEQVAAMEARAKKVGVSDKLNYLFPSGWNAVPQGVNASDAPRAAALGLGDRLLCDLHTLDGYIVPPTRPLQMDLDQIGQHWGVPRFHDVLKSNTTGPQGWGALNLETNCGDHTLRRALEEGYDLNMFANEGNPRLKGRAASFCMERSGYQEGGLNDQGLIFFLPNMTWAQPPFFVHKMITDTLQPNAVSWSMTSSDAYNASNLNGIVSAQVSDDGNDVAIRFLNPRTVPVSLSLRVIGRRGCVASASTVTLTVLHSANLFDVNTPAQPTAVSPVTSTVGDLRHIQVPANSFAVATLSGFLCDW